DVLGDAAVLALDNVRLADSIQQSGLTVVNVAHDGDHWGALFKHVFAFSLEFGFQVQAEAFEQFLVFVLWGDDKYLVAQLFAEDLEGCLVQRLGSGSHFTKVEQYGYQCCRVGTNLVSEVGDRRATAQTDLGVTGAAWNIHAAQ